MHKKLPSSAVFFSSAALFVLLLAFLLRLEVSSWLSSALNTRFLSRILRNRAVAAVQVATSWFRRGSIAVISSLKVIIARFTAICTVVGEQNSVLGHRHHTRLLKLSFWFWVAPSKHLSSSCLSERRVKIGFTYSARSRGIFGVCVGGYCDRAIARWYLHHDFGPIGQPSCCGIVSVEME